MTVYNGEKFLPQQLDSILCQTHQNIELVICDDCSQDGSFNLITEYAAKDDRIRLFKNDVNLGLVKNFEKAISLCKGDFIAMADQDDIWSENHIEVLLENIGDKSLICGNWIFFEKPSDIEAGNRLGLPKDFAFPENDLDLLTFILCRVNPFPGNSMLFRKDLCFMKNVLPFPIIRGVCHDWWLEIGAIFSGNGVCMLKDVITIRRIHGDNVTGKKINRTIFKKIKSQFLTDKEGFPARILLLQEIERRFELQPEQKKTLELCEIFLKGRLSPVFSKNKIKGLIIFAKKAKQIVPRSNLSKQIAETAFRMFLYLT